MSEKTRRIIFLALAATMIALQIFMVIYSVIPKQKMNVSIKAKWRVIYSCGSCGYLSDTKWRYCPICGADTGGHDEMH